MEGEDFPDNMRVGAINRSDYANRVAAWLGGKEALLAILEDAQSKGALPVVREWELGLPAGLATTLELSAAGFMEYSKDGHGRQRHEAYVSLQSVAQTLGLVRPSSRSL